VHDVCVCVCVYVCVCVRERVSSPRSAHSVLNHRHRAVIQHDVSRDVQRHQIDQTLNDTAQGLPRHLEFRRSLILS